MQKRDLYQNQFSNKKGAIAKPESPKKHPIWAAHPRTHLSTKYPLPGQHTACKHAACSMQKEPADAMSNQLSRRENHMINKQDVNDQYTATHKQIVVVGVQNFRQSST